MTLPKNNGRYRPLEWWETRLLERQGCLSDDWSRVLVTDGTDLSAIRRVRFVDDVLLGALDASAGAGIENAVIQDCVVGDNVAIYNLSLIHISEPTRP